MPIHMPILVLLIMLLIYVLSEKVIPVFSTVFKNIKSYFNKAKYKKPIEKDNREKGYLEFLKILKVKDKHIKRSKLLSRYKILMEVEGINEYDHIFKSQKYLYLEYDINRGYISIYQYSKIIDRKEYDNYKKYISISNTYEYFAYIDVERDKNRVIYYYFANPHDTNIEKNIFNIKNFIYSINLSINISNSNMANYLTYKPTMERNSKIEESWDEICEFLLDIKDISIDSNYNNNTMVFWFKVKLENYSEVTSSILSSIIEFNNRLKYMFDNISLDILLDSKEGEITISVI